MNSFSAQILALLLGVVSGIKTYISGLITATKSEVAGNLASAVGTLNTKDGELADGIQAANDAIDAEVAARQAAVAAEALARTNAINAEETARRAAIDAEAIARGTAIGAEATSRAAALAIVQGNVEQVAADLLTNAADLRTFVGANTNHNPYTISGNMSLAAVISALGSTKVLNGANVIEFLTVTDSEEYAVTGINAGPATIGHRDLVYFTYKASDGSVSNVVLSDDRTTAIVGAATTAMQLQVAQIQSELDTAFPGMFTWS